MDIKTNSQLMRVYVSSEVKFYTISDLMKLLGWSEATIQKLFNDPKFRQLILAGIKWWRLMH